MGATIAMDRRHATFTPTGRGTDPLRPAREFCRAGGLARRGNSRPMFAPMLEEIELDAWSSHEPTLGGNFHDWMLVEGGRVLVMMGQAVATEPCDSIETVLTAQAAWTAVRAHAQHTDDAGQLLSLAGRTLWTNPTMYQMASIAVAIVDTVGGSTSLAIAGDCLAWRVRAAKCERLACDQPPLGAEANYSYAAYDFALSLRERLLMVADDRAYRPTKFAASVADSFKHLDAESHRRMTASDALATIRHRFEHESAGDLLASASIAAVRRR
jgi:hypothetical protein